MGPAKEEGGEENKVKIDKLREITPDELLCAQIDELREFSLDELSEISLDELYAQIDKLEDKRLFQDLPEAEHGELLKLVRDMNKLKSEAREVAEAIKYEKSQEMRRRRGRGRYGEARLAKKVGGVVVGRSKAVRTSSGKWIKTDCQKPPDVVTDIFSFESKWLKNIPKSLEKVMIQAVANCPEGLTAVGVIGDREQKIVYYIMCEPDFISWHVGEKEEK